MMLMKNKLLSLERKTKKILTASSDLLLLLAASFISLCISTGTFFLPGKELALKLILGPILGIFILFLFGVYGSIVRYINFSGLYILLKALFIFAIVDFLTFFIFPDIRLYEPSFDIGPSSKTWIISWLLGVILIIGSRFAANSFFKENKPESKVVIYGAGSAGIQLAEALRVSKEMQPVAFIDKNPALHDTYLGGIKVSSPHKLKKLISSYKVDEVLIAIPSASKSSLSKLLKEIEDLAIKVRILPGLAELAQGKVLVSELKEVDISDLLGRIEVEANQDLLLKDIKDKVVLITGGGGSIGSEIAKQVALNGSKKLIILDTNEYSLYSVKQDLDSQFPDAEIFSVICNVTNKDRMLEILSSFNVDTIYHTAAYKHVPLVEENPFEGLINNVFGTQNTIEAAMECCVETFVLISTDKAVRPTNIMGATKRLSEMILQSNAEDNEKDHRTRMTMVRFGNVLGSSGSAVPLFQQQIKEGGPVTVTDSEVIRYFMSISEAAELVIQAGAMGEGGDVFVLDMGDPVKIYDLAKRLIRLSGLEIKDDQNPEGDIEISLTGLRPGEKLYEELLIGENVTKTIHQQIWRAEEESLSKNELDHYLQLLKTAAKNNDVILLRKILEDSVYGFSPSEEIVDTIYIQKNNHD